MPGPVRRAVRALRRLIRELQYTIRLRALPPRVAWFQWRARRLAWRTGDRFSLSSATRPADLALLLELARDHRRVVELGTGTAWTALTLALADPRREVISFDPVARPERERYVGLVGAPVRERVGFITAPGEDGPRDPHPVDLLYIDSSHHLEDTVRELRAWEGALRPGALVVFDDYSHADFPGVRQAVEQLRLQGAQRGTMFVHEVGARRGRDE